MFLMFHFVQTFGLISHNPVLKNITDYLVDEGSYEEELYLGKEGGYITASNFLKKVVNSRE